MRTKTKSGKLSGFSEKTSDIILVAVCAVVLFLVAYPLYYVLIASVSDPYDVFAGKTFLLPSQFTLDGYKAVFAEPQIVTGLFNSFKYTIIGTVFSVVVLYLTAAALPDSLSAEHQGTAGPEVFEHFLYHHHVFWRRDGADLSDRQAYRADQ